MEYLGVIPTTFLPAKIRIPQLRKELVLRLRLFETLDDGLKCRLILISASAGFGKTTLLSQWAARLPLPVAWLWIEPYDQHLGDFLSYLVASIQRVEPQSGLNTLALLNLVHQPEPEYLASALAAELQAGEGEFVLVLDDYHWVKSLEIHCFMVRLMDALPERVHLVISSRVEPPLSLAKLRLAGKLLELRNTDLRFNLKEVDEFLNGLVWKRLPAEAIKVLSERSEGWIAGLQMAALSLKRAEDPLEFVERFDGTLEHITDYLIKEVIEGQPEEVVDFMLRSSVTKQFSSGLCDALAENLGQAKESEALLERLVALNPFLIPLDDHGIWFRYNQLFRDVLLKRLRARVGEAGKRRLLQAACGWYEANKMVDEAINTALEAEDVQQAVRIIEERYIDALERDNWRVVERWLGYLPNPVIFGSPKLLLARASVLLFYDRVLAIELLLNRAKDLLAEHRDRFGLAQAQSIQGQISAMWAVVEFWKGNRSSSLLQAWQALVDLPKGNSYYHGLAALYEGFASIQGPDRSMSPHILWKYQLGDDGSNPYYTARLLFGETTIQYQMGHLCAAESNAKHLLAMARAHHLVVNEMSAYLLLGKVYYERNDLEAAREQFSTVYHHRAQVNQFTLLDSTIGLALVYANQQQGRRSREILDRMEQTCKETDNLYQLSLIKAAQAHIDLINGNLRNAEHWRHGLRKNTLGPLFYMENPEILAAMVLVAESSTISLERALRELDGLLKRVEEEHTQYHLVTLLGAKALTLERLKRGSEADQTLAQAVELGESEGFIRSFLDLGSGLLPLLERLAERTPESGYLRGLVKAFTREGLLLASQSRTGGYLGLTQRELEILELLGERYTNKEIAAMLHLSADTVKTHCQNIYQKLGVSGRREAVRVAQQNRLP